MSDRQVSQTLPSSTQVPAEQDARYMARAIELAKRGWYTTHPNPRVGCVLVADTDSGKEVIGEGYHLKAGEPHAERNALADANAKHPERIKGCTAYVTLEPCSHHGRTPPCSEALVAAEVGRVVIAMQDPNPLVAGSGIKRLQEAGITVHCGVLESAARELNPGFIRRMESGRPLIRCKLAMSLDGRTAMANGESKWITGDAARSDVQRLRAQSSAVMTGVNTILADDPSLNVREQRFAGVTPTRIILDSKLRTPPGAKLFEVAGEVIIVTASDDSDKAAALKACGAKVVTVSKTDSGRLALAAVIESLKAFELNEILLECGPTLSGAMLQANLIDELVIYMAPTLMGSDARGLMQLPELESIADKVDLSIQQVRMVGNDIRITASIS